MWLQFSVHSLSYHMILGNWQLMVNALLKNRLYNVFGAVFVQFVGSIMFLKWTLHLCNGHFAAIHIQQFLSVRNLWSYLSHQGLLHLHLHWWLTHYTAYELFKKVLKVERCGQFLIIFVEIYLFLQLGRKVIHFAEARKVEISTLCLLVFIEA